MGVDKNRTRAKSPGPKSKHRRSSSSSSSSDSSSDSDSSGSDSSSSSTSSTSSSGSSSSSNSSTSRQSPQQRTKKDVRKSDRGKNRDRRQSRREKEESDKKVRSGTEKRMPSPHSPDEPPPALTPRSPSTSPPPQHESLAKDKRTTHMRSKSPVQVETKKSTRMRNDSPVHMETKRTSRMRNDSPVDMETASLGKRSDDELSIGPDEKDMYEDDDVPTVHHKEKMTDRARAYSESEGEEHDSDDSYSWRTEHVRSVLQSHVHKPTTDRQRHRSASYEREDYHTEGRFRSVVGTTIKRPSAPASPESGEILGSDEEMERADADTDKREKEVGKDGRESDRTRSRHKEGIRSRVGNRDRSGRRDKETEVLEKAEEEYRDAERNFRKRRFERDQEERSRQDRNRNKNSSERPSRQRERDHEPSPKRQPDVEEPVEKKARKQTAEIPLQSRTGGAYIPPAKLRMMQEQIADKSSAAYQRLAWEALKKSINGLINKTNVSNIGNIIPELLQLNIVRGRGLLARSIVQAQTASPTFTPVFAALVAVINCKFPQNGELILKRLIINFKKGFRRNDKTICLAATRFIGHLVNQQVAHEVIALEILTLLLENPSDDSVEVSIGFVKECGLKLSEVTPRGLNAIFDRLRGILHEAQIDQRVQYMVEVIFANRKDGFKDFPAIKEGLDLVEESEQYTHLLTLEDNYAPEDVLNVFKEDSDFLANEERYKAIRKEILGEDSDDSGSEGDGEEGSGSEDRDTEDEEQEEAKKMEIIDKTETNMIALRRTIYLTIQSSLDFEECAHKMLRMEFKPGQEKEVCLMILDCCAQQRTYEKFFGLLAQRFCQLKREYMQQYEQIFPDQYEICHRLDTNKLRNVAKFFAHLLLTDAVSWTVLSVIKMNEEDTTSSSRIFVKIMFQELSEYMGLPKLNERLRDPTLQPFFDGLMPRDNPANTRFSINFFTTIGLGGLTDDLREHLKNYQRVIMQQQRPVQSDSSSNDSSDSSSDSSDSSDSSSDSSDSSSSESEEEPKHKKSKKKKDGKIRNQREKHPTERQPKRIKERDAQKVEKSDRRRNVTRADERSNRAEDGWRDERRENNANSERPQQRTQNRRHVERDSEEDDREQLNDHHIERRNYDRERSRNGPDKARNKQQKDDQDARYDKSPHRSDGFTRKPKSYERENHDEESDSPAKEKSRKQAYGRKYETDDKENRQRQESRHVGSRRQTSKSEDEDDLYDKRGRSTKDKDSERSYKASSQETTGQQSRRRNYSHSPEDRVRRERTRDRR